MKNIKKLICLAICILICFSLCSCNAIDAMREVQMFYDDDNNIEYDGKLYKLLPECSDFNPISSFPYHFDTYGYATEKDLPVLLCEFFGDELQIMKGKELLYVHKVGIYAREDIFDSINNRITSGNYYEGYAFDYNYYTYDKKESDYPTSAYGWQMLSYDAYLAIYDIFGNYTPQDVDPVIIAPHHLMNIYLSSKDFYFTKLAIQLYQTPAAIYIASDDSTGVSRLYQIPDHYFDLFQGIIDDYNELEMSYEEACEKYGVKDPEFSSETVEEYDY